MATDAEVTVTVEPATAVEGQDETAAETVISGAVVEVAEMAVALAEGQAALAHQQAAEIVAEHQQEVADLEVRTDEQDRSLETAWRVIENVTTELARMQTTLEGLTSLTPPSSQASPEEVTLVATVEPETAAEIAETISSSTPSDTSAPTSEIRTEASSASAAPESEAPARRRVRRFL